VIRVDFMSKTAYLNILLAKFSGDPAPSRPVALCSPKVVEMLEPAMSAADCGVQETCCQSNDEVSLHVKCTLPRQR